MPYSGESGFGTTDRAPFGYNYSHPLDPISRPSRSPLETPLRPYAVAPDPRLLAPARLLGAALRAP